MVAPQIGVGQRDVWWADLGDPIGSVAGFIRPVIIVQNDAINVSRLATYLCIPLTSNLRWKELPWNLFLSAAATGLDKDSVAQTGLMFAVDRNQLTEQAGRITARQIAQLFHCLDIALGRAA